MTDCSTRPQVADVRRERELMEKRKCEPQLEQAQDHLVRKIFSRFRRERSVAAAPAPRVAPTPVPAPPTPDPERGEPPPAPAPAPTPLAPGGARGKWGRLLAGGGAGGSLDAGVDAPRAAFMRSLSTRERPAATATAAAAPTAAPAPADIATPATSGLAALTLKVRHMQHFMTRFIISDNNFQQNVGHVLRKNRY